MEYRSLFAGDVQDIHLPVFPEYNGSVGWERKVRIYSFDSILKTEFITVEIGSTIIVYYHKDKRVT